ncbi:MAG: DcaP family trimeric outer membrane transporter [Halioglobus sp.]
MKPSSIFCTLLLSLSLTGVHGAQAQQADSARQSDGATAPDLDMAAVIALLREQQKELAAQRQLLEAQAQKITTLTRELDGLRAPTAASIGPGAAAAQPGEVAVTEPSPPAPPSPLPSAAAPPEPEPKTEAQQATLAGESVAAAQTDDPTRDMLKDFTGAWRLPGTDAALAIGGFVKTDVVYNFDPLEIADRFIVGSIPVGVSESTGDVAQSSITADQSRLNFDLREPTQFGLMRAFIEGDFAGSGETFRLRHAFGQWNRMLAGKTWSTFVDPEASPEEIDFEGLNARINVRQSQIRYMPKLGEEYELQVALEDPNPEIQNGTGVSRTPDFVLAGRFSPNKRLHMKLALLARQIRAQAESGNITEEFGWGTSLSGRFVTPRFDPRDNVLFQLNYGNGIGRYVNDLSSIGNYDGIFDPTTGELQLFHVVAGYISFQHWWAVNQLRSNFTFGAVDINNPGFIADNAYLTTLRFSSNLIWSPIPRIDIGGEYLWGSRENKNGKTGDATQLQFAVKYRF